MSDDFNFYVYVLFRPWNGEPFYVGKGKGDRLEQHEKYPTKRTNKYLRRIFEKSERLKLKIPAVKVRYDISEVDAFETEIALISVLKRSVDGGPLANQTLGGEGLSGLARNEETIAKVIAFHKGRKRSPETCARIGAAKRGMVMSVEARAKVSAANKGKVLSPETRAKISAARFGKRTGAQTPEWAAKSRVAGLGKKRSAELCEKLSIAKKRDWVLQKYDLTKVKRDDSGRYTSNKA